ncbi:YlbD family protein [Mesobacillus jeotgali]|uniref:YlbD family protein n=1 Tax=Mesobacillus jeotgali TaxID=129985 RepID=A0ABY9VKG2_9BACI|nr:YlbD family protein [Mesobacillus jeotgali]WNF24358.1 YlbD family protein [Mesobacillus jeotgali]
MAKKKLHPSVVKFKEFVKNHPELVQEVRKGNTTWQEMYEDWYLLGEDDPKWNKSSNDKDGKSEEKEKKTDWLGTIMGAVKNMDPEQVQGQIHNISQALGAIQGVLSQFQGSKGGGKQSSNSSGPAHPFSFRQD